MNNLPTVDELTLKGEIYGTDYAKTPNGIDYLRFSIIKYNKSTYVLENQLFQDGDLWRIKEVVKRLL